MTLSSTIGNGRKFGDIKFQRTSENLLENKNFVLSAVWSSDRVHFCELWWFLSLPRDSNKQSTNLWLTVEAGAKFWHVFATNGQYCGSQERKGHQIPRNSRDLTFSEQLWSDGSLKILGKMELSACTTLELLGPSVQGQREGVSWVSRAPELVSSSKHNDTGDSREGCSSESRGRLKNRWSSKNAILTHMHLA